MKLKFEMTPSRHFQAAFWLGWLFHFAAELVAYSVVYSSIFYAIAAGVCAFTIIFIYTKNSIKFDKELLWMTIKNPRQITEEELKPQAPSQNQRSTPPMPPVNPPVGAPGTPVNKGFFI